MGVTYHDVRAIGSGLPGVEEGTSYGTPALKVKGKLFARLWEDGETLVLRVNPFERPYLLDADPAAFFLTDHYRDYPWVLVRLAAVDPAVMRERLEDAWRLCAPKKLVAAFDAAKPG